MLTDGVEGADSNGWLHLFGKAVAAAWALSATGVTIVIGARDLWSMESSGWAKVLAFTCAAVIFGLLGLLVWQMEWGRERVEIAADKRVAAAQKSADRALRLASNTSALHRSLHMLRDYAYKARTAQSADDVRPLLLGALEAQAEMWSSISGVSCRVCLKEALLTADAPDSFDLPDADPRYVVVRTYLRHHTVDLDSVHDEPTPLMANTDFNALFTDHRNTHWYFSNDIDKERNYGNPHRGVSIDYNATMNWPIQKRIDGKIDIWGFLCVDSMERGVFDEGRDFGIGAGIADTLYTSLTLPTQVRSANLRADELRQELDQARANMTSGRSGQTNPEAPGDIA